MESLDRRTLLLGVLGAAGTAAVAACSGGSPSGSPTGTMAPSPTATPTPSPTDTRPRWPLTGRLLKDPAAARHAAVAVKVPDNKNEHPQVGLDKADIVFVELDGYRDASGYSSTRLVPVFHSRLPDDVGPVRSIRPVDVPLLGPIGAVVGNTGATGWVGNYVKHYGGYVEGTLTYLATKGTGSYSIDPARVRTYRGVTYYDRAVVCHPEVLAKQTRKFRSGPARAYFPFASTAAEVSTASGKAARTIRVPWKKGDSYDMGYAYDEKSGKYLRSMPWGKHVLANGTRVATDNVLVIRAKQRYAKIYRGSGGVEPVHDLINAKGTFFYFHGGRYVTGTWAKGALGTPFQLTVSDGRPLRMAPGQTYVELPQYDARVRIGA
jgi:hypothetical protein